MSITTAKTYVKNIKSTTNKNGMTRPYALCELNNDLLHKIATNENEEISQKIART
jgi:hypothetical protein